jgi:hypothetical protein
MSEQLGKTRGLEVTKISMTGQPKDTRVALDFFSGGGPGAAGPFVNLTIEQWIAVQQLARSIKWPAA